MEKIVYDLKNDSYFLNARKDIIDQVSLTNVNNVLDIGCGSGATLAYIKSKKNHIKTIGVEPFCDDIHSHVDQIYKCNVQSFLAENEGCNFDLILCLDVLEHIWLYEDVLLALTQKISESGKLIISVPNIANFRALIHIFILNNFPKDKEGIFDETHCRWFTCKVLKENLERLGFSNIELRYSGMEKGKLLYYVNKITFGIFQRYLGFQIIAIAKK